MPKGQKSWNKGLKFVHRGSFKKGNKAGKATEFQKGHTINLGSKRKVDPWNKGKKFPRYSGENAHNWRGGTSFIPYPPSFNEQLKDRVRVRDNFICQHCGIPELECENRLVIHHKDRNKFNSKIDNLIALCKSCHTRLHKLQHIGDN